jgi:hypothetical protein
VVNRELTLMKKEWDKERRQLLGHNAVLKDAANRLNLQMQDAQERAEQKERRHEKARDWRSRVYDFLFWSLRRNASLIRLIFTGAGRGETDNWGFGRGLESRALPFASPHSRGDPH